MSKSASTGGADVFKQRVTSYFKQLNTGCGREGCVNVFCRSNPGLKNVPPMTASECGVVAMNLTRTCGGDHLCNGDSYTGSFLDLTSLQTLVSECEKTGDETPLIRSFGSVWDNTDALQISFLKNPKNIKLDGSDTGLDFEQVTAAFEIIKKLPENVQRVFAGACERLLGNLKRYRRTLTIWDLRKYLILLENPMFVDHMFYKRITGDLFGLLATFPPECEKLLKEEYIFKKSDDNLLLFHQRLQDYISVVIMSLPSQSSQINGHPGIQQATVMIGWIHSRNKARIEEAKPKNGEVDIAEKKLVLKTEDFYNEVVCEHASLRVDFVNWKKRSGFTFANSPFLLNAERKSKLLQMETYMSQQRRREESLSLLAQGYLDIPFFVMKIRRDKLIEDSLDSIMVGKLNEVADLKKPLKVKFEGEDGIDEGGVQKEWFQLLVSDLFSPKYGMFIPDTETQLHFFNPHSQDFREFELLGTVLGLAIYNSVILDLHFPNLVYKKLMNRQTASSDLKETHPSIHQSLIALMEYQGDDIESEFLLTFQISYELYGATLTHDLLPGGEDIPVNSENKELFVDLYARYLLEDSVSRQFEAFKKGFDDVCKGPAMDLFEPEELQLLICGSPALDFQELETSTVYDAGYDKDHQTVRDFWSVVHELTPEEKRKFLFFTTGSDRSPIGGLGKLRLIIGKTGEIDKLPTSHTCFNHFVLPSYSSKEKLREMLKLAIENATGFGLI